MKKKLLLALAVSTLSLTSCGKQVSYTEFHEAATKVEPINYQTCRASIETTSKDSSGYSKSTETYTFFRDDGVWNSNDFDLLEIVKKTILLTYMVLRADGVMESETTKYYTSINGFECVDSDESGNKVTRNFNSYGYLTQYSSVVKNSENNSTSTTSYLFSWQK